MIIPTTITTLLLLKSVLGQNECNENPLFCDGHEQYRTINGSCNNVDVTYLGKSDRPYKRALPNSFGDGMYSLTRMRNGSPLPSTRVISNLLFPAGDALNKRFTLALMQMGQLVAHDLSFNGPGDSTDGCCTAANQPGPQSASNDRCADINIPDNDPDYKASGWKCLSVIRTKKASQLGCPSANCDSKVSTVTSYLDLSVVYGNNKERLAQLRSNIGGLLKVKNKNGYNYPRSSGTCLRGVSKDEPCYLLGDVRVNQNPQLTSLHIVFFNEHNRIAKELANVNPGWDDEKLFQEARRINIAQYQHIVFNEILNWYIGEKNMIENELLYSAADACVDDYDSCVDPTVYIEFATAAFRHFHSLIVGKLQLYNKHRELVGVTTLSDYLERPIIQELNSTYNIHNLVRGLTIQAQAESDAIMDHDTKCKLFKRPLNASIPESKSLGSDLAAVDLERNRDHGVGLYVEAREWCGLSVPRSWDDLAGIISDSDIVKLKAIYKTVDNIELYVGGTLEKNNVPGSMMGETFYCFITRQFYNTRKGDRFFYENCEKTKFTPDQLKSIKQTSLARILCDNSNIDTIQPRVTELIDETNAVVQCDSLPKLDYGLWKDNDKANK